MKFTFGYGLRFGGGIADGFQVHTLGFRLLLDLSYYCVVLVVLLNIIFGIIIDTFSSLRADKVERLRDTLETCFICGIDKKIFDRAADGPEGFKYHVKMEHNMWNYLFFIFHLWEQDKDDDDGMEQFIRRQVDSDSIAWFPINKAMSLNQDASESEILKLELHDCLEENQNSLVSRVKIVSSDVKGILGSVFNILKSGSKDDDRDEGSSLHDGVSRSGIARSSTINTEHPMSYYDILISLHHISDVNFHTVENLSCRLICDVNIYSIDDLMLNMSSLVFISKKELLIGSGISMDNSQSFQIQFLSGSDVVASFEMMLRELIVHSNSEIEKKLMDHNNSEVGTLTFHIHCRPSKLLFSRTQSIDEDDQEELSEDDS